ncbi:hypothetical protein ACRYCC_02320 [Actinomadura scrupuli]|uniref:hypothetical protein n=1 Tax=Actinomadura scrupuli TaxID=559629 RepID=UPI003D9793AD
MTARHVWAGDIRLHYATIYALERNFWSPRDPMVGAVSGSPYYSPYVVVLAALGKLTGVSVRSLVEYAGIFNIVLLLVAIRRFCSHFRRPSLTATLVLVFTLTLWGLQPRDWSGFLGLYSLSWTLGYPSVFAAALMFFTWDAFLRFRARPAENLAWAHLAVVSVLVALVALIHPFTAINTVLGLIAFALADLRGLWRGRPGRLALAAVPAVAIVVLWPWSDVLSLFGASGEFSGVHLILIEDVVRDWGFFGYGLALLGLPALVTAARRPLGRELQILCGLSAGLVALGAAAGSYGFARVIPVVVLSLHLALASYLADRALGWNIPWITYATVTVVACAVGVYGNAGGLIRAYWGKVTSADLATWRARDPANRYDPVISKIHRGDVVISDDPWAGRLVNARGAYTVVPAWPYPFVDEAARRRDSQAFFAASTTPRERTAIAGRYHVKCVILSQGAAILDVPQALPGFSLRARTWRNGASVWCRP